MYCILGNYDIKYKAQIALKYKKEQKLIIYII